MVKDELGVHDEDILNAIRFHTTGAAYMTKLAQIIYMADYIEPGRDFPAVKKHASLPGRIWELALPIRPSIRCFT